MENWSDILNSPDLSGELKASIKTCLLPDNIQVKQFLINFKIVNGSTEEFFLYSGQGSKSLGVTERYYPPFYPAWFIAGYPDIVVYLLNKQDNSKLLSTLSDSNLKDLENNYLKKIQFLRLLIDEYLLMKNPTLECTDESLKGEEIKKTEYPKNTFDSKGRLIAQTKLVFGYETNKKFFYNDNDQIIRIDEWGNDQYGPWKLSPKETFEYNDSGLLVNYLRNQHGGVAEKFSYKNEYNENRLISREGRFSKNYKKKDTLLKFEYNDDKVQIYRCFKYCDERSLIETVKQEDLVNILNSYSGIDILK